MNLKTKNEMKILYENSWCPPCKAFTPKLVEFYETLNKKKDAKKKGKLLEIIYVSSDKYLEEFEEYYTKMPWLAIPTDEKSAKIKDKLAAMFKIRGIPTLVLLDVKTGYYVTDDARNNVLSMMSTTGTSSKAKETAANDIYQLWKETPPVPIEQANFAVGGGGGLTDNPIGRLIKHILKNPIWIFGLLYLYRQFMNKMNGGKSDDDGDEDNPLLTNDQQQQVPADEPEF